MKVLAIVGSPRKGKSTDSLVDKAIAGVKAENPDSEVKKINLSDFDIKFCLDCLSCWKDTKSEPYAKCVINDEMNLIFEEIANSERLILGTPVHMGFATGIMMTFLERICWTFARPEKNYLNIKGCPGPRSKLKRKAVIITVSGIIPPVYKKLCNWATPQIKQTIRDSLNAKTVGTLYAGDVWNNGVEKYYDKAFKLGRKLII